MAFPSEHCNSTRFITDVPTVPSEASRRDKWLIDIKAWEELFQEMWYLNQEEEPLNHSGQSVLFRWLNRFDTNEGRGWSCCVPLKENVWCTWTSGRPDRAITHVRGHLNLKPYPCEGECGNQDCTARFGSNENRNAHYLGPDRRPCEWCKKEELRQNMHRHKEICPKKPTQPGVEEFPVGG